MSDYSGNDWEWEERWRKGAAIADALRELDPRIDLLEQRIAMLEQATGPLGHNQPPETVDDLPVTRQDIEELRSAIATIRTATAETNPEVEPIEFANARLKVFASRVAEWAGARGTKFADAAVEAGGKVGGAAVAIALLGLLPSLVQVIEAVEGFVRLLGHF